VISRISRNSAWNATVCAVPPPTDRETMTTNFANEESASGPIWTTLASDGARHDRKPSFPQAHPKWRSIMTKKFNETNISMHLLCLYLRIHGAFQHYHESRNGTLRCYTYHLVSSPPASIASSSHYPTIRRGCCGALALPNKVHHGPANWLRQATAGGTGRVSNEEHRRNSTQRQGFRHYKTGAATNVLSV
jgi:hypothetical protein